MKISRFVLGLLAVSTLSVLPAFAGPKVVLKTNQGDITLELDADKAPESVKNFLAYVGEGYYDKTVFHRVIDGFMIQGGGFALKDDGSIEQKETKEPVQNEAKNGLKNAKYTVAMARTNDPHSATSQFFINVNDNTSLDFPSFDGWGYAVFGKVVSGQEIVDKIGKTATGTKTLKARAGGAVREVPMDDVPNENVVIESAKVAE